VVPRVTNVEQKQFTDAEMEMLISYAEAKHQGLNNPVTRQDAKQLIDIASKG
jgi:hypothetical protein